MDLSTRTFSVLTNYYLVLTSGIPCMGGLDVRWPELHKESTILSYGYGGEGVLVCIPLRQEIISKIIMMNTKIKIPHILKMMKVLSTRLKKKIIDYRIYNNEVPTKRL